MCVRNVPCIQLILAFHVSSPVDFVLFTENQDVFKTLMYANLQVNYGTRTPKGS